MNLDQTFIAIRQRGNLEIYDLALHFVRDHFRSLMVLLFLGALPLLLLNWWMTCWIVFEYHDTEHSLYFYWVQILLVASQAQLGTSFVTQYMGLAMFVGRPSVGECIKKTFRVTPCFLWVHGILRMAFVIPVVVWMSQHSFDETLLFLYVFLVPLMLIISLLIRTFRPFVSEILLLEKTPVRQKTGQEITFFKRSKALHSQNSSLLIQWFLLSFILVPTMAISFYGLFITIDSVMNLQADSEWPLYQFYWMAALWLVAGFTAVVRFLAYIDLRIRQEGWAVELKIRAEGQRLRQHVDSY